MSVTTQTIVSYLDEYLRHDAFADKGYNGIQVAQKKETITKMAYAVDATTATIQAAADRGADMLLVHHGLLWGEVNQAITQTYFAQISLLMEHDMALYATHIPLDAHADVGNNIGLLQGIERICGLSGVEYEAFGDLGGGETIGWAMKNFGGIHYGSVLEAVCPTLGLRKERYGYGESEIVQSIAVVTGQGTKPFLRSAHGLGYDMFITGECVHADVIRCQENKMHMWCGGHWETEKIGPKLLCHHLQQQFDIETLFVDKRS